MIEITDKTKYPELFSFSELSTIKRLGDQADEERKLIRETAQIQLFEAMDMKPTDFHNFKQACCFIQNLDGSKTHLYIQSQKQGGGELLPSSRSSLLKEYDSELAAWQDIIDSAKIEMSTIEKKRKIEEKRVLALPSSKTTKKLDPKPLLSGKELK